MLNERKLTERELDKRAEAIQGLLSNKRTLVKKYGKDAEKVMYGIATKQAKSKVENMNKEKIKELIQQALQQEQGPASNVEPYHDQQTTVDTGFSGRADYGEEDKALDNEDELEMKGFEENINEGHGLGQKDLDTLESLRNQIEQGILDKKNRIKFVKVLDFLIKSNILQDKTKDLSKGKVNEQYDENDIEMAVQDLRDAADNIEQAGEDAREIVRQYFPNELSRLDAYGAFSNVYSANRYDVTLGSFIDRLEEKGFEVDDDGDVFVNEGHMMSMDDLDVGHIDNEPHMLKKELARAGQMIQMLYRAVDKYDGEGEVDFPQWWQKKIIQANAMLDSAFDYIDGEEMVAKIDAVIDSADEVEVDIDVVNEEDEVKKRLAVDKAVKSTLKDEGGAAGLDPLVKAVKKLGVSKDELKSMIKKIVGVAKHKHGDYISTPINEAMDGGQLFDYFANKGYKVKERRPDGKEAGFQGYMVSRGDGPYPQSVIFQYDKDVDQFMISQMSGYRIDQKEAMKAGMRETGFSRVVGIDSYITDGNYTPVDISVEGLKDIVDHVMSGIDREGKAQGDFYRARGRTSGTIDEKELSKSDEKALKKIEKALKGSSKAHKSQADKISKIVKEKLTKSSSVEDHIEDFKDSDAPQFKGKSLKKIKQMALASFLSKQKK
tara:strand:- start:283 stop:2268 length:1986 start_codon:yes stop_codon:yes gene_type:complete